MILIVTIITILSIVIVWSLTLHSFRSNSSDRYACLWILLIFTAICIIILSGMLLMAEIGANNQNKLIESLKNQNKIRIEVSGDIDELKDRIELVVKQDTTKL